MDENDVHLLGIGFTELEALTQKRIDVAMTFLTNEPVQARTMGLQVQTLEVSPYANLVSTGLATGERNVQERPELVQRFVTASLHGLRDTVADPDAAFAASLKRMPEIAGSDQEQIQRQVLDATITFEQAPPTTPLAGATSKLASHSESARSDGPDQPHCGPRYDVYEPLHGRCVAARE